MKTAITLAVSLTVVAATALLAVGEDRPPFTAAAAAASGNAFACDLYHELSGAPGNLFFSPSSISTALAMTYAGARGATAAEMAATLCLPDDQAAVHAACAGLLEALEPGEEAGYVLEVANRLWGQYDYPLKGDFLAACRVHYGGGYAPVDFVGATEEARTTINDWVADRTEDRIRDLLEPGTVDPLTCLVLTNAVYFHGLWQHAFDPVATRDAPFHTADGRAVETPFMHQSAQLELGAAEGLRILRLPYEGGALACYVLLPDARDGLAELESRLDAETLDSWLASVTPRRVDCALPRFELTSEFDLGQTLAGMGMPTAFTAEADFTGISEIRELYISRVVHEAYVDVFEEGTEAAAATAVVIKRLTAVPDPSAVFRADHPFLFLIRHEETGAVLFMGRLTDPDRAG